MVFSSITFLYYFLPVVLVLYYLVPAKGKNLVLFLSSLVFYAWGEPKYVFLMLISIVIGYAAGLFMDKLPRKPVMVVSVGACLFALIYFKYTDFFINNVNALLQTEFPLLKLALPIGISFYTFQIISYILDVYRGKVEKQTSFLKLATYVSMFPQLIAGPIVRYSDINAQLIDRRITSNQIANGIIRFVIGLSKKVLLANQLGELCQVFRDSNEKTWLFYWVYAIAVSLQVYFDFSGYSDMAIGLGKMLGFTFMENFDYPFMSKSVTSFWRRWHISLGNWFRDYVYIPLGGNRKGLPRQILNILVVWLLTGFWHGAQWNFVLWGLFFAALLMMEKMWLYMRKEKVGNIHRCDSKDTIRCDSESIMRRVSQSVRGCANLLYMFLVITVSFVIFSASDMGELASQLQGLFYLGKVREFGLIGAECMYYIRSYGWILLIALLGATDVPKKCYGKIRIKVIEAVWVIALLLLSTAYLIDGSFNPFLYFRF